MYRLRNALLILLTLIVSGCEQIFESTNKSTENLFKNIYDCVTVGFDEGPIDISTLTLSSGQLGVNYTQVISTEIKSEPDDDDYLYQYTYNSSELPSGLSFRISGRNLFIEGVSQAIGMYPIFIEVYSSTLDSLNAHRPESCKKASRTNKNYILIIT